MIKRILAGLLLLLSVPALAQTHQKGNVTAGDCTSWYSDQYIQDLVAAPCLKVGGTSPQIQYNKDGKNLGGFTMSGDVTVDPTTGIATVVTATSAVLGKVRPDNVTCTVSAGVLTCPGGGGSTISGFFPAGRLTLVSGSPVQAVTAGGSTIYYDSYIGNTVPVWSGSAFVGLTIVSNEISLVLDLTHATSGNLYDVFAFSNSGALTMCIGPAWTNFTARSAGTVLTRTQGGIYTNNLALTHCYNNGTDYGSIAQYFATYLGSVLVPSATGSLAGNVAVPDATISVTATSGACGTGTFCFPNMPGGFGAYSFYILIDSEIMLVTSGQSTGTWNVTRAQRGTSAATHTSTTAITMANGQAICMVSSTGTPVGSRGGWGSQCDYYNAYNKVPFSMETIDSGPGSNTIPLLCNGIVVPMDGVNNAILYIDGIGDVSVNSSFSVLPANSSTQYLASIIRSSEATSPRYVASHASAPSMTIDRNFPPILGAYTISPAMACSGTSSGLVGFENPITQINPTFMTVDLEN